MFSLAFLILIDSYSPHQYSCLENPMDGGAWKAEVHGVAEGRTRLTDFTFTFHFHALEKEMATHSSVLAWRIPGTREAGGLPSMGLHRVGHDWSDLAAAAVTFSSYLEKNFKHPELFLLPHLHFIIKAFQLYLNIVSRIQILVATYSITTSAQTTFITHTKSSNFNVFIFPFLVLKVFSTIDPTNILKI